MTAAVTFPRPNRQRLQPGFPSLMLSPLLPCLVASLFMNGSPAPTTSVPAVQLFIKDGEHKTIQLQQPFVYAGTTYSHLYLNMDGYVSFSIPNIADQTSSWIEVPNPQVGKNIIAPLWTDLRVDQGGSWTYEQATNGFLLKEATNAINIMFPSINFSASWVFVSTWENVPLEWTSGVASLQVVLVSDSEGQSYALLNYGTIPSIPSPFWLAGFDVENSDFITIAVDDSSQLSSTSNSNIPGCWAFQVSNLPAGNPVPANFYPFWHGAKVDLNNGSSSQITLQRAFQYFESYMNTIHVNKNGVLSFSEPLHEASPDIYANNTDIIAPFWTDFVTDDGKVIYQEVTDGPLLARATQDINTMFPGIIFMLLGFL
ncbi:alpha-tectorin-like [Silurus meridionalis]|uniref:alpha-tectorin-like n=1 Tax=Silurus meridionalis TaxID=175797 RepID=UPI001EEB8E4D|nr:alpha-tectorin-like [Silurus meridionalis]